MLKKPDRPDRHIVDAIFCFFVINGLKKKTVNEVGIFLHKAETSSVLLGALFIQLQATFTSVFWVGCNLWNVSYKGCGQAAGNRDAVNPGIFRLCRGSLQ